MCFCFTSNENCHFSSEKTVTSQNGLLIFHGKETHSETKSWKSLRILTKKSYNNSGKPWKSSRILRVNPIFLIFSFIFSSFHFSSFLFTRSCGLTPARRSGRARRAFDGTTRRAPAGELGEGLVSSLPAPGRRLSPWSGVATCLDLVLLLLLFLLLLF